KICPESRGGGDCSERRPQCIGTGQIWMACTSSYVNHGHLIPDKSGIINQATNSFKHFLLQRKKINTIAAVWYGCQEVVVRFPGLRISIPLYSIHCIRLKSVNISI